MNADTKTHNYKVFALCWLAYVMAYLCRNNLAIAIPVMQEALGFTKAQLGLLGSLFFWVYGVGQLINGSIGDKIPTVPFISLGLLVSGIMNLLLGLSDNLIIMCILWAINGYFLSMLWGPIIKTLSNVFSSKYRSQISVGMSTSMVGGFLLAWGLIGWLLVYLKWMWAFIIPGISMIVFSIVFYFLLSKLFKKNIATSHNEEKSNLTFFEVFKKTKLIFIVITCMAQGIIKDGISLWAPTILIDTHNLELNSTIGYILLIPILNLLGMFITNAINKKFYKKEKITALILFICSLVFLLLFLLFGSINPFLTILLIGLCSSSMYGSNTILLGVIPLSYKKYNKTSTVAGLLDFSSYVGAGFFALISGIIITNFSWTYIIVFWIVITILATLMILISIKTDKRYNTSQ